MFGGADPAIPDLVPADIEVAAQPHRQAARLAESAHREFEGVAWTVKNLFELKNARRVLVDGNLFEYNWPHAQNGFAILFTVRNQDGGVAVVDGRGRDLREQPRPARRGRASTCSGTDDIHASQPTRRIAILQQPVRRRRRATGAPAGCSSSSTARATSASITTPRSRPTPRSFGGDRTPHERLRLPEQHRPAQPIRRDRIGHRLGPSHARSLFPARGRAAQRDRRRARRIVPGRQLLSRRRSMASASSDAQRGDYRLAPSSPYKHAATDGRDPGADIDAVAPAIARELGRS